MSFGLKDELLNLKGKLENLEGELTNQMMELEVRAEEWHKKDEEVEALIKAKKDQIVTLNIGGKLFQTKLETLLSVKDTIFYAMILSKNFDFTKELFIDRKSKYFHHILSYLRNKKFSGKDLNSADFDIILEEAEFYEIQDMIDIIVEMRREIKYVSFESSGTYSSGGVMAGTNNVEDLNNFEDKTCMKGIVTNSPGWIILQLNRDCEWEEGEIGGWKGNTNIFSSSNGNGASIMTSMDKNNWNTVATIPSNFGNSITPFRCNTRTKCKYIKFNCSSHLGIGYFKIKKE
jgi:hypothetical protein